MDIPLVLESLRPTANWGRAANTSSTYAELLMHWADKAIPCPTEQEMLAEWDRLQTVKPIEEATRIRKEADEALKKADPTSAAIRALSAVLLDEINAIRTRLNLPARTRDQLFAAIKTKLDTGSVDAAVKEPTIR